MRTIVSNLFIVTFVLAGVFFFGTNDANAAALSGAIFTTTVDGSIVNENVRYDKKEDVYLDGGPGPRAPAKAAGLPEGDYYFQVTDPSGKDLLSTDHISCRKIHVNANGVIDFVYEGTSYVWINGGTKHWEPIPCQHAQGTDIDHSELGAITVQLYPYDDTPNPGGVYKVWITPVEDYAGDPDFVPVKKKDAVNGENYQPGNYHGFIPSKSKTDNFKVKYHGKPHIPPEITVIKFHDRNINGIQDEGEEDITGWAIEVTDPLDVLNTYYTPVVDPPITAEPSGIWTIEEDTPAGSLQTVSYLDGEIQSIYPNAVPTVIIDVQGESGETHEVIYGNVGVGSITACKIYDRNANGIADEGEPGVAGWRMQLIGNDILGNPVGYNPEDPFDPTFDIVQETGSNGCTTFDGLLPGIYTVTELIPSCGGWVASSATSETFVIESSVDGATVVGSVYTVTFTNYCIGTADFGTKGYWHNKNGLEEITDADIEYINGLAPYSIASSYFGAGDEPFDGEFEDGTPVDAAYNNDKLSEGVSAGAGTARAEISHFLVDSNAGGDPREQLAQQLLAFIFNVRHRLDDPDAAIKIDGLWVSAQDLIDAAIVAWEFGTGDEQTAIKDILDNLNNSDNVEFIHYYPCPVSYQD